MNALRFFKRLTFCCLLFMATQTAFAAVGGQNVQTWQVGVSIPQGMPTNDYVILSGNPGTMSVTSGTLPTGVSFNELSNMLWRFGGTPEPGTANSYSVTHTDSEGGTMVVAITVSAGPQTIVQSDITTIVGGAPVSLTPHSINGNGATIIGIDAPTYTYGGGNAAVATIDAAGNITVIGAGSTTFTIDAAANASYQAATQKTVTITVLPTDIVITPSSGWNYNPATHIFTITDNGTYTIAMVTPGATSTADRIVVASGVTADITLDGVSINMSATDYGCAFDITGATVNLTLQGNNTLISGRYKAGLQVPGNARLTIAGSGTLTTTGGVDCAGIGSDDNGMPSGIITINSGTINATGGVLGAGIGGSNNCAA